MNSIRPNGARKSRLVAGSVLVATVVVGITSAAPSGTPLAASDTLANATTALVQSKAKVARAAAGNHVVAWSGNGTGDAAGIFFQRYNQNGVAQGGETRANTTTAGTQDYPAIAADAAGNFVVVWESDQAETPAGSDTGIWAQLYNSGGVAQGAEFQVNSFTGSFQGRPAVAMDGDGDFVVAWQSLGQDGSGQGVYAQRYNALGVAQGAEFRANTFTNSSQAAPSLAMTPDGAFVIVWQSNNQEGVGLVNGIYAQRYLADGTPAGAELHVNASSAGEQIAPAVGISALGRYVVAWESPDADSSGILATVIDETDSPVSGEIPVNSVTAGAQTAPVVAVDVDGDFVVAWEGTDASGAGVRFQRFSPAGVAADMETVANNTTTGTQQKPAIAADADGDYVIAWASDHVVANGFDAYSRRFSGPEDVDLAITKTDTPDPVVSGNAVTYTLKVNNNHAAPAATGIDALDAALGGATGIVVTDTLPTGVTFNSTTGTHANWSCSQSLGVVTCSHGPLLQANTTSNDIKILVTTALAPGEITNTAIVVANQADSVAANNTATQKTASCVGSAEAGSVQLSAATSTVGEAAGSVTITATRTGGLCGSVSVNYATSDGTAIAGSDYTAASGTLTWAENDNANKTFTVPITSDPVDEPDETVNITLSNADRATLGSPSTAVLTITDDDAVTITFTAAAQTVDESAGMVTVTASRTGTTTFDISIPFTVSGSANAADHSAVNGAIVIPAAQSSASYTFSVVDDMLDENTETVTFTMDTPTGGTVSAVSPTVHTVSITDNDATPEVNFNPVSATVLEGNTGMTMVTVTVELSAISGRNVTVPFAVSGTATDIGDHTAASGNITITAGNPGGTYTFNVNGDTRNELDETVVLTMGTPTNAAAGSNNVHTTTITNDDSVPGVTLSIGGTPMDENAGVATITATLDAVSGRAVTVNLSYSGTANRSASCGTLQSPADYNCSAVSITIPAGSTTGTATVTAIQDTRDETNETIVVDVDSVDNGTEFMVQQVTATITDDDPPPNVTLTLTDSPLAENGGVATVSATLAEASEKDATITLSLGGTATLGTDYTSSGTTLLIPAGSTTPTTPVTLTGVDDTLDEVNETIVVDMVCDANCNEATAQQVTATITDDDAVTVSFSAATQTVDENVGMVTVTVVRTGASTFPISVPYTLSGTAVNPADHNATAGSINIIASTNATESGTYTFLVSDDVRDEADETLIFTMGTPTGGTVTSAPPSVQTVTITDNDAVTVSFSAAAQTVGENAGNVTVTVVRTGTTDFAISVPFTVSGSAINPADHNAADGVITIPAASANGTYVFAVAQDTLDENSETVVFTIGTPTGGTVSGASPTVHTVTITDDDPTPTVQFVAPVTRSVAEDVPGGTTTLNLVLSAPSALDVTVNFATTGTAVSGTDYTLSPAPPGPVLIPAGQTSAQLVVTVNDDPTDEADETATITLQTPSNATLGANSAFTLTILDNDDTPQVSFTTASQNRAENFGTAQVTVQLSRTSTEDVNVPFTVSGTANGSDYTITPSPVTIVAGTTSATINVAITNDTRDEANETVIVTMGTPTNATPTGTTVHTVTITDDDSVTVTFSAAAQAVGEGAGTATVTVTRSATSDFDISVPFTVSGTAENPADHSAVAGVITIPAASTSGSYVFNIVQDSVDETNETVVITMGTPTGGDVTATAPTVHTVTITDDDTSTIAVADATVTEGTGTGTTTLDFVVTLSTSSASTVTVDYATADGTALQPGDYASASGTLTFTAGQTSKTVSVTVVRDAIDESDETLNLNLSNASGAAISDGLGLGTITDDDTAAYTIDDVTVTEGNSGTVTATFTVTRTASAFATAVDYATANGTAVQPGDYASASGTLNFPASTTTSTQTLGVLVNGDLIDEVNESFAVNLTNATGGTVIADSSGVGTITDDDTAAYTIDDVTVTEGNSGTVTATFTVTRTASAFATAVDYATANGTAQQPGDYTSSSGTLNFPASTTTSGEAIAVSVNGDVLDEAHETFTVNLTNATGGAAIADSSGLGTITDDDAVTVAFSVSSQTVREDIGTVTVTVVRTGATAFDITVPYTVSGTALNPADHDAAGGSVVIPANTASGSIVFDVVNDKKHESTENVAFTLGTPTGGSVSTASPTAHVVTITDNDSKGGGGSLTSGSLLMLLSLFGLRRRRRSLSRG